MSEDKTREKILEVADKLFGKFGFHKTSMDEIAKTARKAKGSLYYHFKSKEDLFREVVAREIGYIKDELIKIVNKQNLSAKEKFKTYLMKRMELFSKAYNYHETLKADFFEHFDFIDDLRSEMDIWEKNKIKQIFIEGVKANELEDNAEIEVLLDVFLMVLKGLEIPFFIQDKYKMFFPHFDGMINILIKGMSKE